MVHAFFLALPDKFGSKYKSPDIAGLVHSIRLVLSRLMVHSSSLGLSGIVVHSPILVLTWLLVHSLVLVLATANGSLAVLGAR
jgi:hypothetical protein